MRISSIKKDDNTGSDPDNSRGNSHPLPMELELLTLNFREAIARFIGEPVVDARDLFLKKHLPLLIVQPLAAILCPLTYILGKGLQIKHHIIIPLAVIAFFHILAMLHDKLIEHGHPPGIISEKSSVLRNITFYSHLTLSGSGFFFIFHPVVGYAMLFLFLVISFRNAIMAQSSLRRFTPARTIAYYIASIIIVLVPLLGVVILANIFTTFKILFRPGIL